MLSHMPFCNSSFGAKFPSLSLPWLGVFGSLLIWCAHISAALFMASWASFVNSFSVRCVHNLAALFMENLWKISFIGPFMSSSGRASQSFFQYSVHSTICGTIHFELFLT